MKKVFLVVFASLFLLVFSSVAGAESRSHHHHDWSGPEYRDHHWNPAHEADDNGLPFRWHEHRDRFQGGHYRMERIQERGWKDRFPGLHSYRWHDRSDEGFWYHGQHITNAVLFYNNVDELVSVGFMQNGSFIFIRDDHQALENQDSFFFSWVRR